MGLDMYLYGKTYVRNYNFTKEEEKYDINITKNGNIVSDIKKERIVYIIEELGYWRKANQIHNFFVENCQEGIDDCKESYVSKENIKDLLNRCNKILENPKLGKELLPTVEGFFFGNNVYDQYYLEDIKYTKELMEECLLSSKEIYYQSSW